MDEALRRGVQTVDNSFVPCLALEVVKSRMQLPAFEKRLYRESSDQARFLMKVCAEAGSLSLRLGKGVFRKACVSLAEQRVKPADVRGLLLGFHAKAVDELVGIRAATSAGSLGAAMTGVRVLFEIFVRQSYILKEDTERRAKAYRLGGLDAMLKDSRQRIREGEPTAENVEQLLTLKGYESDFSTDELPAWTSKSVIDLAGDLGMPAAYANLYRMTSYILHANDADCYNPILHHRMLKDGTSEQACFLTNCGFWTVGDAIAFASFLDSLPVCLFGNTARLFNLDLSDSDRRFVEALDHALREDSVGGVEDIRHSFPELFP